jgi:pentatricopeptide repeat protein
MRLFLLSLLFALPIPAAQDDTGPVQHVIGFSGPVAIPMRDAERTRKLLATLGFKGLEDYYKAVLDHMKALSAPMARVEFFYVGKGRFEGAEKLYESMESEGFEICGSFNPIPPVEALDDAFDKGLEELAKRHPKIKSWQIGNEPDLLWKDPKLFPPFFIRSQRILRKARPDAGLVLGGISNQYDSSETNFKRFDSFLAEIAKAGLKDRPFDVFDIHYYKERPQRDEIDKMVRAYRDLLDQRGLAKGVTFWCT